MRKRQPLTYAHAVQILVNDDAALRRLDQLLGLGLLVTAPAAPAIAIPLLTVKDEIMRRLADLTAGLRARTLKALARLDPAKPERSSQI